MLLTNMITKVTKKQT